MDDVDKGLYVPATSDREFSEAELEIARQVYDETRHFLIVPPSFTHCIYRYGIMPKKTVDGNDSTRLHGSRRYWRDPQVATPNGALIIHRDDPDPNPGTCDAFIHPPYAFGQQYRGEKGSTYIVTVSLKRIARSAVECGFCSILYQGVYLNKSYWRAELARYRWLMSHPEFDPAEVHERKPWDQLNDAVIDEDEIVLHVAFPRGNKPLTVHLGVRDQWTHDGAEDEPKTTKDIIETMQVAREKGSRKRLGKFEYYTEIVRQSLWFAFGPAPHIEPDVLSHASIGKTRDWIAECFLNHRNCQRNPWIRVSEPERAQSVDLNETRGSADAELPMRLIRLRWGDDTPIVNLEETSDPLAIYRYVALSHVWAFTEPHRTTMDNYSTHTTEIPWDRLSLPLRQAIVLILNLQLELEYIWIDSLCIIQDDSADKLKELPRMSSIYSQAEIVFVAHGPDLGFDKLSAKPVLDPIRPEDAPVYCRRKIPHENIYSSPRDPSSWTGRAWCMQEYIFAPRIIHFGGGGEELFFECNTLATCECGGMEDDIGPKKLTLKQRLTNALTIPGEEDEPLSFVHNSNDVWKVYITACEDYTPRGLTFDADKLPAISSLMHTFLPYLGKYYAGLWEHNLIVNLQWEAWDTSRCERHKNYVGP